MTDARRRGRNALLGLALGDALGWPAMFHRSYALPAWLRRIRREIDGGAESTGVLRIPMPFSLNQSSEVFSIGPTDDAEWCAWTMSTLLQQKGDVTTNSVTEAWQALAHDAGPIRGGISTQTALANIRRGLLPPASGRDNPHYFDDGAACRAVPIGVLHGGDPAGAAGGAFLEASATNADDGVWGSQAVAAAISAACGGGIVADARLAALEQLPSGSWIRRVVEDVLERSAGATSLLDLFPLLHEVVNKEYNYGCAAPETVALMLSIVSVPGCRFEEAVTLSGCFGKTADSLPPLVGALAGALAGDDPIPPSWVPSLDRLRGICIPSLAGESYIGLVDRFLGMCPTFRSPGSAL